MAVAEETEGTAVSSNRDSLPNHWLASGLPTIWNNLFRESGIPESQAAYVV